MKTFSSFAFLAIVAVLCAEARFEVLVSAGFALGFSAIVGLDYGYRRPALKSPARPLRKTRAVFRAPSLNVEPHRLAA